MAKKWSGKFPFPVWFFLGSPGMPWWIPFCGKSAVGEVSLRVCSQFSCSGSSDWFCGLQRAFSAKNAELFSAPPPVPGNEKQPCQCQPIPREAKKAVINRSGAGFLRSDGKRGFGLFCELVQFFEKRPKRFSFLAGRKKLRFFKKNNYNSLHSGCGAPANARLSQSTVQAKIRIVFQPGFRTR